MKYIHGGDIYRNKIEYDFSVNINPLGFPENIRKLVFSAEDICEAYPDYSAESLRSALSAKYNLPDKYFMLSNGACEALYLLAAHLLMNKGKGFRTLSLAPTFSEYEMAVKAYGGIMDYYFLSEENCYDVSEDILEKITSAYSAIFLCNPNNPTGRVMDKELLKKIANKCEDMDILLVVDESFIQFIENEAATTMLREINNYNNLLVVRAFTKLFAIPGLRLGFLVNRDMERVEAIRSLAQPWNTSTIAQRAGVILLGEAGTSHMESEENFDKDSNVNSSDIISEKYCHEAFIRATKNYVSEEREYLLQELKRGLAFKVIESNSNYILFRADKELYARMLKQGILIRKCQDFVGLTEEHFRIAVKTHDENEELIRRWRKEYGYS